MSRTTSNSPVRSDGTASNVETADNQCVSIEMADTRKPTPDLTTPDNYSTDPLAAVLVSPDQHDTVSGRCMGTCACRAVSHTRTRIRRQGRNDAGN
jgi:hypothetical protein